MHNKPYLVGVAGGSASGKTHLLKLLTETFHPQELCVVSLDNYYKGAEDHIHDTNGQVNYDLPECIELANLLQDITALRAGNTIARKEYLFQRTDIEPETVKLETAPIILIEGLFIFHFKEISEQLDLKVMVDAEEDIRFERRMKRDVQERGIPKEQVLYQWEHHVKPAYEAYLAPYRSTTDMVINNNQHFDESLVVLKNHFRIILQPS